MNKIIIVFLFFVVVFASCTATKKQFGQFVIQPNTDTIEAHQAVSKIKNLSNNVFDSAIYIGNNNIEIHYRLFKPKQNELNGIEKYPLVVVYHGSGPPIGSDNKSHLGVIQKLFASSEIQTKYPAYVLAPQFPTRSSDYKMDTVRNVLYSTPRHCLNTALQLIDSLKMNLNIDHNRIYVVGFSMGGSTTINSLMARPDLFAAGISISGIPQFDKIKAINKIPIWLLHGIDDTENTIFSDEYFYKERKTHTLFWKLKGTTHGNLFTPTILGETLPAWLFAQHR